MSRSASTLDLTPEVRDVLSRSLLRKDPRDGLILPAGLDRPLYEAVNDALERLGGRWSRKAKAHVFPAGVDPRARVLAALDEGTAPARNPLAYFATPLSVANRMIELAGLPDLVGQAPRVLEPSAGEGALADVVLEACPDARLDCVELDPDRARALGQRHRVAYCGDFLGYRPVPPVLRYDAVVMNPPFAVQGNPIAWFDHVMYGYELLARGGRLIAVTPAGWVGADRPAPVKAFRELVLEHGAYRPLPDDAFKEAGTGVKTVLVALFRF